MTPEEARLKEIAVLERLAVLYGAVAGGKGASDAGSITTAPPPALSSEYNDQLTKLPLTDSITEYLRVSKRPQSARAIWAALEKAGRQVEADNPIRSVQWALKKIVTKGGPVFHTGWGKWHHKERYTKPALAKLLAGRAGRGGRSEDEHIARTNAGLARARASGKRLGATPKIDEAMKLRIQQKAAQKPNGKKIPLQEIADGENIGLSSIFAVFPGGRKAILAWKPTETNQEDSIAGPLFDNAKTSHVRLVK